MNKIIGAFVCAYTAAAGLLKGLRGTLHLYLRGRLVISACMHGWGRVRMTEDAQRFWFRVVCWCDDIFLIDDYSSCSTSPK